MKTVLDLNMLLLNQTIQIEHQEDFAKGIATCFLMLMLAVLIEKILRAFFGNDEY